MVAKEGSPALHSIFDRFPELARIPKDKYPESVLVIPDGNVRYAITQGLPVIEGHRKGALALQKAVDFFVELPYIHRLLIWGFSNDNWSRPQEEREGIMAVTEATIRNNQQLLHEHRVRFLSMGSNARVRTEFPSLWRTIYETEQATQVYTNKELVLLVDFSGQDQDLRMLQRALIELRHKDPASLTLKDLHSMRDRRGHVTPADLIIRTSGEQRTSDIGWLARNAEFYSIPAPLPEVVEKDFANALVEYSLRKRRFGGRPDGDGVLTLS